MVTTVLVNKKCPSIVLLVSRINYGRLIYIKAPVGGGH